MINISNNTIANISRKLDNSVVTILYKSDYLVFK
jgi:hypothetical protein